MSTQRHERADRLTRGALPTSPARLGAFSEEEHHEDKRGDPHPGCDVLDPQPEQPGGRRTRECQCQRSGEPPRAGFHRALPACREIAGNQPDSAEKGHSEDRAERGHNDQLVRRRRTLHEAQWPAVGARRGRSRRIRRHNQNLGTGSDTTGRRPGAPFLGAVIAILVSRTWRHERALAGEGATDAFSGAWISRWKRSTAGVIDAGRHR